MGAQFHGLIDEIEICRKEMVRLAAETSFANQEVIETSMKLDTLLNKYHYLLSSRY